jgi:hypothetical protein
MQHTAPAGDGLAEGIPQVPDLSALLGTVSGTEARPYVVLKYAQTLDGASRPTPATRNGSAARRSDALRTPCARRATLSL